MHDDTPSTRWATRLCFLVAGFSMSAWAPLVPYAKARLGLDEAALGALLLCIGIGSVTTMPMTGGLVGRWGCRRVIGMGGFGVAVALPILASAPNVPLMAAALLLFGASLGAIDVAINVHASRVEQAAGIPLMSGFHGLFSLGGFLGAGGVALCLSLGLSPFQSSFLVVGLIALLLVMTTPRLLTSKGGHGEPFLVRPRGLVLLLGSLCFICFLTEGAVLDWSALLLTTTRGIADSDGGWGYAIFSVAMTCGRLSGDKIVKAVGTSRIMVIGGLMTALGFAWVLWMPSSMVSLAGFAIVGLGASNIVPVLFSAAGRQQVMPSGLAIAAMSTLGYLGILTGPALLGAVAHWWSLPATFALLAVLMLSIPLAARAASGR